MNTTQSFFDIDDLTNDLIYDAGGLSVNGINGYALASTCPGLFSIEQNDNGTDKLCTSKMSGKALSLTINVGNSPYICPAEPFIPVAIDNGVVGPHPTVIFTLKPGGRK